MIMNNYIGPYNNYYGGFRTRTFSDIFPSLETFTNLYTEVDLKADLRQNNEHNDLNTLYYLLYGRYGGSHISYDDENQFIYALFSTIFMYGSTWSKRLEIQEKVRNLTEDEILKGDKAIYNHAYNPGTAPSTATLEELPAINDQNTTNYKKAKITAYEELSLVLKTDVTEEFISKFKKLFIVIGAPDYPIVFETIGEIE